jgi:predicted SnoaL-like aldol condensation-catalyzing enzyme
MTGTARQTFLGEMGDCHHLRCREIRRRKEIAQAFLRLVASGKVREAYESFVAPGFRHHNPYFPGDAGSLRAGMEEAHARFPQTTIDIQCALEEGDVVAVHSRVKHEPAAADIAVAHILRFDGMKIIELWDIAAEAPKDSPNQHGMF